MLIRIAQDPAGADWQALDDYLTRGTTHEGPPADHARAGFPPGRIPQTLDLLQLRLLADAKTLLHRLQRTTRLEVSGSDVLYPLAHLLATSQLAEAVHLQATTDETA